MKVMDRERVFLVKELPADLYSRQRIRIKAGEFLGNSQPDALRLKQIDDEFFLVKRGNSARRRTEHIIPLRKEEFEALWKVAVQKHEKVRYSYPLAGKTCEIELYQGKLKGYVRLEVEFKAAREMRGFKVPGWFGKEITDIDHEIHEDLGKATFEDMAERYSKKGIALERIGSL